MSKEIELVISHDVKTGKTTTYDYRFGKVRELVKDGSLRVTDIAKETGYNKGHVSRLRKEATKKEWVGLTDDVVFELADTKLYEGGKNFGVLAFAKAIEQALKEKNT
jgi:hypothetical protein